MSEKVNEQDFITKEEAKLRKETADVVGAMALECLKIPTYNEYTGRRGIKNYVPKTTAQLQRERGAALEENKLLRQKHLSILKGEDMNPNEPSAADNYEAGAAEKGNDPE